MAACPTNRNAPRGPDLADREGLGSHHGRTGARRKLSAHGMRLIAALHHSATTSNRGVLA